MNWVNKYIEIKPVIIVVVTSALLGYFILEISNRFDPSLVLVFVLGIPTGLLVLRTLFISSVSLKHLFIQLNWCHFLWFLVFMSGLVFRIRDTNAVQENPLDIWALYRLCMITFVGYVLMVRLAMKKSDWLSSLFRGSIGLLAAYAFIGLLSSFWSVFPMWTLYKSLEYTIDLALIAAIIFTAKSVHDLKILFDLTWVLLGLLAASAWIGIFIWPDLALRRDIGVLGPQIGGVIPAMETNQVGQLGAILCIVAINRLIFLKDKKLYIVILLAGMATLIFAQSRSPIFGFIVAIPLMLFASRRIGPFAFTLMLLLLLLNFTGITDTFWEYFQRGQDRAEFASLSGRTYGWALGWELFKENPLLGYGAYAGGRFAVLNQLGGVGTWSTILNTWLEVLLGVGLIGAFFIVWAFLRTWKILVEVTFSCKKSTLVHCLVVESIGILALISVRSMFTTNLFWHPPLLFFLVMGYAEFLRRHYRRLHFREPVPLMPFTTY